MGNASVVRPRSQRRADLVRSLRLCTADGLMAMPVVTMALPVNVFITALVAKAFPLSLAAIGWMSAMPSAGNFLQAFAAPFLHRWRPPKTVTVVAATCHLVTWLALGFLLPHLRGLPVAQAGHWLIGWFLLSSLFAAVAGVSWNAWIEEWVPARLRGKYFGRRNAALQVSTLTFLLAAGFVLARWDYALPAFQAIIVVAGVMRVFSIRFQWISPTPPPRAPPAARLPFAVQWRRVLEARSLLVFVVFGAAWSFAANCFGPFYYVFLFEEIHLSAFDVGILSTLSQLGGVLSLHAWGRLLDRYGNKSVMTVSLLLWQVQNFAWCFLNPHRAHLLYGMWLWGGVTSAGFILGQFTILLRLIPASAKNLAIGVNLAFTSLVAAAAPVLGGALLTAAANRGLDSLPVYHAAFLVQPVVAIAACALLLRVREPSASPLTMVFGAMRNIRTLSGVLGLSFLTNYIFYRAPRRNPRPPRG